MMRKSSNISTIKDVAEKAGVSTTTVSHVVNKTRFVSEDLIQRVRDAIQKLNYQPSGLARSLRTRASGSDGLTRLMQTKEPPSAVFACNDIMAIGALAAARELGIDVPDQLSLVGFDDIGITFGRT